MIALLDSVTVLLDERESLPLAYEAALIAAGLDRRSAASASFQLAAIDPLARGRREILLASALADRGIVPDRWALKNALDAFWEVRIGRVGLVEGAREALGEIRSLGHAAVAAAFDEPASPGLDLLRAAGLPGLVDCLLALGPGADWRRAVRAAVEKGEEEPVVVVSGSLERLMAAPDGFLRVLVAPDGVGRELRIPRVESMRDLPATLTPGEIRVGPRARTGQG